MRQRGPKRKTLAPESLRPLCKGSPALLDLIDVYEGSNGETTMALYARLRAFGALGEVAMNLFRACKNSERAKRYRGGNGQGSYRKMAYERKGWSIDNLVRAIEIDAGGISYGWGLDPAAIGFEHVLYLDLPDGQVSFHCPGRGKGPDYPGQWDGKPGVAPIRICKLIERLFNGRLLDPPIVDNPALDDEYYFPITQTLQLV